MFHCHVPEGTLVYSFYKFFLKKLFTQGCRLLPQVTKPLQALSCLYRDYFSHQANEISPGFSQHICNARFKDFPES
jgi:hypothetical protein